MILKRILAALIDICLYGLGILMVYITIVHDKKLTNDIYPMVVWITWFIYLFFITCYLYKNNGQTLGYMIMKLRLITTNNTPLTFSRILLRMILIAFISGPIWFYRPTSSLLIFMAAIFVVFTKKGKPLGQVGWDLATRTAVILAD